MTTAISLQQILQALNSFLPKHARVNAGNVVFAWEKDVDFQAKMRCVSQARLVPAESFPGPFAASFETGPDWVNASAVPFEDERFLITIAAGRGVGNLHPSLNVSYELDARAEIILTKTLVTAN